MKKIIYTLFALVCFVMSSCTNDDITIDTENPISKVQYSVRLQDMYDEFDISEIVLESIRDGVYSVGVTTLVYDEKGILVDSAFTVENSLNAISQSFELPQASYTFITIETVVDRDTKKSNSWRIDDKEKQSLSTVKINFIKGITHFLEVVGVYAEKVEVNAENITKTAVPKAIGSMISAYFYNLNQSEVTTVGIGCKDIAIGYFLDPYKDEKDRYIHDVTDSGYFTLLAYKSVNDQTVSCYTYVLDQSIKFSSRFRTNDHEENSWSTFRESTEMLENGESYYSGVYYFPSIGKYKDFFGDLSGFIDWRNNNQEIQNTQDVIVPNVYTNWGGSVSDVQSFMQGYSLTLGQQGSAVSVEGGTYEIRYNGVGNVSEFIYGFTSGTTGLFESDIMYDKSKIELSVLYNYLNSNYKEFINDLEGITGSVVFVTYDMKTVIMLFTYDTSHYCVGFVDYDYVMNMSSPSKLPKAFEHKDLDKIRHSLKKIAR